MARLPKRERDKLRRLKKKKLKLRIPTAKPTRVHKSKRDYKRVNKVDYDQE